jgi:putative PIN family toxin of toxin-antitoxin system
VRVVLDTNVLFAAFVTHGVCAGLYEECLLQADILVSDFILSELADRLVAKGKFTQTEAQAVVQAVRKDAIRVSPVALAHRVCRDANDDWVLATAITAQADAIVTGDKDLLVLKTFEGIAIVTPRGFLALMQGNY